MSSFHTEPGSAPVDFTIGDIQASKLAVGTMDNNVYLLTHGDDAILIDAADDAERILAWIGDRHVSIIVTTHQHRDHIQALAEVAEATGATLLAGTPDLDAIEQESGVRPAGVWTGDVIATGGIQLEVAGLVGHTPGGIALICDVADAETHIFTGDSLFPGGVGKTSNPEAFHQLLDDVETQLFDHYGDDTVIHPGHGDATTLGAERGSLAQWRQRGW